MPTDKTLLALYRATTSPTTWKAHEAAARADFDIACDALLSHGCADVLEIGCFDGAFYQYAKSRNTCPGMRWSGVEPATAAAAVARDRDVNIVGESLAALSSSGQRFDAVVAIDVFEHVSEPLAFLDACHRLLRPGGIVLIATGAIDSVPSHRQAIWNYVAMPEHVCFMSKQLAEHTAQRLGMSLDRLVLFRHSDASGTAAIRLRIRSAISSLLRIVPWQFLPQRLRALRGQGWTPIGQSDHWVVCWKKPPHAI